MTDQKKEIKFLLKRMVQQTDDAQLHLERIRKNARAMALIVERLQRLTGDFTAEQLSDLEGQNARWGRVARALAAAGEEAS